MKTHNERVIQQEDWNREDWDGEDIYENGIKELLSCMICSAPDLNSDNHVACFLSNAQTGEMELVEVICNVCWDQMENWEQTQWIDYFDQIIEP